MTCHDASVLLHAVLDRELDAGHAREVEGHLARCSSCEAQLRDYRDMREAMLGAAMAYRAPEGLRRRLEGLLPVATLPAARAHMRGRRATFKGFAMGSALSMALAACLMLFVVQRETDQRLVGDVVSAHLRSLQSHQLIDVKSTDQHTVKPWFNGRLDLAPPVIDLKAQGFTLIGGRLDYIGGQPVAAIVYQHQAHIINLFVSQAAGSARAESIEKLQGFNVWRWAWSGLGFFAVSDISAKELKEFGEKLEAAVQAGAN